jgi:G:T-mismatch repair DNA endonuclease (very short patch repair protein)
MDTLTPDEQSERISRTRSKDTRAEPMVRRLVHWMFAGASDLALGFEKAGFDHDTVIQQNKYCCYLQGGRHR